MITHNGGSFLLKIILCYLQSSYSFYNSNAAFKWTASSEFGTYHLCESRGTFRQKARSLAPLNGWACTVKICHDGMLEDTNSLDGAQITTFIYIESGNQIKATHKENHVCIGFLLNNTFAKILSICMDLQQMLQEIFTIIIL